MSDLADRIRASREQWVTAGGFKFNIRRPTLLQLSRFEESEDKARSLLTCVVGWEVPEKDIVPGGGGKVPPFDSEAFREWVEDRPDVLNELSTQITALISKHFAAEKEAAKNS
jgi:hypothetical protein